MLESRDPGRSASRRAKTELDRARDIRLAPVAAVVAGAFLAWAAIFLKAMVAETIGGEPGLVVLMAAVIAAAWFGGTVAGTTALVVTFVLNAVMFEDFQGLSPDDARLEVFRELIFLAVAAASVLLVGSRRASRDRLADALDEAAALADAVEGRDERLEIVLAASNTGFWEWDLLDGQLVWSEAIFRQNGIDPSERAPDFAGFLQLIHADDRERLTAALGAAIDGTAPYSLEFRVVWPDGSVHWIHGAGRVFRDAQARPFRMLGTGQDITERRRIEDERDALLAEERRANEFREAFIDVISHELRTPITTILGISQILSRPGRSDGPAIDPLLEDVRAESERLHRLVEDLLVLSRVERGRLVVDPEPLEPRRLLERIVQHEALELPTIDITLDCAHDLPIVAGEATYVEQIVRNLLGNAAKYTPAGTPVQVRAKREGPVVTIRVVDSGPGIPAGSVDRVFELFYRDPVSARAVSGSGIGLFVCASLVEAMGGRIWARRRREGGAEFGFTLRVLESDEDIGGGHGEPAEAALAGVAGAGGAVAAPLGGDRTGGDRSGGD